MPGGDGDSQWRLRPSRPDDIDALTEAHVALFPVDYDRDYFRQLTSLSPPAANRINCLVASEAPGNGDGGAAPELAGFVAFTTCALGSLDPADAKLMSHMLGIGGIGGIGGSAARHDATQVLYILSLGVLPQHRRRGLASRLIAAAVDAPAAAGTAAVFLHVAAYNHGAHQLYLRLGFRIVNQHQDFYVVNAARAPDPGRCTYDAYVFARRRRDRASGLAPEGADPSADRRLDLGWRGGGLRSRPARGAVWNQPCRDSCLSLPGAICGLPVALLQHVASVCGLLPLPAPRRTPPECELADADGAVSNVAVLAGSGKSLATRRTSCPAWTRDSEAPPCAGSCCRGDPLGIEPSNGASALQGDDAASAGAGGGKLCGSSRPAGSVAAARSQAAGGHEMFAFRQLFRPTFQSSRVV